MISIQNTRIIAYGNDKQVTAYQDMDGENLWYIAPMPTFALRDGTNIPDFTLIEYQMQDGPRGICTFIAELVVAPDALQAVQEAIPGARIGQFQWVDGNVYLQWKDPRSKELKVIAVHPSLEGSLRTAFNIALDSKELLDVFKAGFGPGATGSTFEIVFDVTTLTKIEAFTATVSFNVQKAMDYEKSVDVSRNMWGSETSRSETIRENLTASDAGKTTIDWSIANPSAELQQRVSNWAFKTLEGLVNAAADEAAARLGPGNADKFNASYMASFTRSYSENQVIEWVITESSFLPAFGADEWKDHYKWVDIRDLVVDFTIIGDLKSAGIEKVLVTVDYRGDKKDCTFLADSPNLARALTFPGKVIDNVFDPNYKYKYEVVFKGEVPYTSPWIDSSDPSINIPMAKLGIQNVQFITANTKVFEEDQDNRDSIEFIDIDFFFATPEGKDNVHKTGRLTAAAPSLEFQSSCHLPSAFQFTYALTYVMKSGNRLFRAPVTVPPQEGGGSIVFVGNPLRHNIFGLGVLNPPQPHSLPAIDRVQLTAQYFDPNNPVDGIIHRYNIDSENRKYTFDENWDIYAVPNPSGAYVRINGTKLLSNAKQVPVRDLFVSGDLQFNFSSIEEFFTVTFDPSLVDWASGVMQVKVDLYTTTAKTTADGEVKDDRISEGEVKENIVSLTFRKSSDQPVYGQYYTFSRPTGTPVYYHYSVTYYHAGNAPNTYVADTGADLQTVVLPKDGTAAHPVVHRKLVHHSIEANG